MEPYGESLSYERIEQNVYAIKNKKWLRSREYKNMQCSCCYYGDDEKTMFCGKECINRIMLIECSNSCIFGDLCSNKSFQRGAGLTFEIFETENKGSGLKCNDFIPKDSFVIEYVGEIIDHQEYLSRCKLYHKNEHEHFYCMSLKDKYYIDATKKGGIARFINHSCDPCLVTQKWFVRGYPRIGFFAVRDIQPNEELSFDYQFQRFGNKPQICECKSVKCTGFIGSRMETPPPNLSDSENEDASDKMKLNEKMIDSEAGCLKFARYMAQTNNIKQRSNILKILQKCCKFQKSSLKILMKLGGLKLIWTWMVDLDLKKHLFMISDIIGAIDIFPITDVRQIEENQLDRGLRKWIENLNSLLLDQLTRDGSSSNSRQSLGEKNDELTTATNEGSDDGCDATDFIVHEPEMRQLLQLCCDTLDKWKNLPRNFKIPKSSVNTSSTDDISIQNNMAQSELSVKSIDDHNRTNGHFSEEKSKNHHRDKTRGRRNGKYSPRRSRSRERNRFSFRDHHQNRNYSNGFTRESNTSIGRNDKIEMTFTNSSPQLYQNSFYPIECYHSKSSPQLSQCPDDFEPNCITSAPDATCFINSGDFYDSVSSDMNKVPDVSTFSHNPSPNHSAKERALQYFTTNDSPPITSFTVTTISDFSGELKPFISAFKPMLSSVVINYLDKYRHSSCHMGRITNTDDFKFLARKLTHGLIRKEIALKKSPRNLEMTPRVKERVKRYIFMYMKKFGKFYSRV